MIQKILLATILLLIVLGQILLMITPTVGLFVNMFFVLILFILALYDKRDLFAQDLLIISAIIPVISIISISFEIKDVFLSECIIVDILIFLSLYYLWDFRLLEHPLQLKTINNFLITIPLALLTEIGFLYFNHLSQFNSHLPIYISIIFLISLPIAETLYFFALVQNLASDMGGKTAGVIYATALFTLFQTNGSFHSLIFYGMLGLMLACTYNYSRNTYLIIFIIFSIQLTFYLSSGTLLPLTLH